MYIYRLTLASLLATSYVKAFPSGAGACNAGVPFPSDVPHTANGNTGNGELPDGDFQVLIDGKAASPNSSFDIPVGKTVDLVVEADGADAMVGFLCRIEDGTQDTSEVLSSTDSNVQDATVCPSDIGGLTHTNNNGKTVVDGSITYPVASENILMDCTVLVSATTWFNSRYLLNAQVEAEETPSPTAAATTSAPTPPAADGTPPPTQAPTKVNDTPGPAPGTDPPTASVPSPDVPVIPLVLPVVECTEASPCDRCEGDCDSHSQCKGELLCYQKGNGPAGDENVIPGCLGTDTSRTDFCIDAALMPPNHPIPLVHPAGECTSENPCGLCEGDCDNDDDCSEDLICYQKGFGAPNVDAVPGCTGPDVSQVDWCTYSIYKQN